MEEAIVMKLRAALSGGIDSECKVVYVLAESRKLLETCPPDPMPFALKLYCHWALHVALDNPRTTLPFLQRVDKCVASFLAGNADIAEENRMFREFVFLDTCREQFKQFLQAYDLPTDICDDNSRWHEFLKNYAGVIEDGSLSCQAKALPLTLVDKVVFTRGRSATSESYIPFRLSWNIVLLDKRTLTVEVEASAINGSEGIFSKIHLH